MNSDIIDILRTPENAAQSKISISQTEISEEDMHHEQPSVHNPFQKEMFMYLIDGFKVSIVSKLINDLEGVHLQKLNRSLHV